jgi:hypothetical protein
VTCQRGRKNQVVPPVFPVFILESLPEKGSSQNSLKAEKGLKKELQVFRQSWCCDIIAVVWGS